MATDSNKADIIARIAKTRAGVTGTFLEMKRSLDVRTRLMDPVRRNPLSWVAGAVATGIVVSFVFTRGRGEMTRARALMVSSLGGPGNHLFTLALPQIQKWVEKEVTRWLSKSDTPWGSFDKD